MNLSIWVVCVYAYAHAFCDTCRVQKTTCRRQFSLSTMWESRDKTQVVGAGGKLAYLTLNHWGGSKEVSGEG